MATNACSVKRETIEMEKKTCVITGSQSGLGRLISDILQANYAVWNTNIELSNPANIESFGKNICDHFRAHNKNLDVLINCAGVNEINYIEDLEQEDFDKIMNVNARSHYLMVKHLIPALKGGTVLNIISNASRIPMTSSLAYNASKAAAEMITKQMARELFPRHGITVFGLSPNKLHSTGMTTYIDKRVEETRGWTPEQAKEYQLKGLPIGEETDPAEVAGLIEYLLSTKNRHRFLHGCIIPYGGPTGV